jgi:hypothetical protein
VYRNQIARGGGGVAGGGLDVHGGERFARGGRA